ncbi:MAG: glycosyltransferase family 39 protein [Bacteroidia bacterium]|jgi:hypothetical protein|nr:glycosyltransferase family 39 protein [Bacteroidia bacterium]
MGDDSLKINPNQERLLFCFCLLIGISLRLYHFDELALTNDELSAIYRANYTSFSEMIKVGVIELDMHPPLVQIFIFTYVKLFGSSAWLLKIPFIITGLLAFIYTYRLIKYLFSIPTALFVLAFICSTQYFIVHTITARMYAPGLLITVLFVLNFFTPSRFLYIKAGLLLLFAANIHYMALVTCIIASVSYLIIYKKNFFSWLITFAIAAFLFIIEVYFLLLPQFQQGGLGWLGVPDIQYIYHYLNYVAQFDMVLVGFIGMGLWIAISLTLLNILPFQKSLLFSLSIFVGSFLFAFLYSIYLAPILQFSVLLFSSVFLLASCFCAFQVQRFQVLFWGLIMMLFYNIFLLVNKRQHYEVFYHQAYAETVNQTKIFANTGIPFFLSGNRKFYFDYYYQLNQVEPEIIQAKLDTLLFNDWIKLIKKQKADTLVLAHGATLPYEYAALTSLFYQNNIKQTFGSLSETFVYTGKKNLDTTGFIFADFSIGRGKEAATSFVADHAVMHVEISTCIMLDTTIGNPILELLVQDEQGKTVVFVQTSFDKFNDLDKFIPMVISRRLDQCVISKVYQIKANIITGVNNQVSYQPIHVKVSKGNPILLGTLEAIR